MTRISAFGDVLSVFVDQYVCWPVPEITKFPLLAKWRSSTLLLKVLLDHITVVPYSTCRFPFCCKISLYSHFQRTNYLLSLKFHQEDIYFWSNLLRKKSQNKTFSSVDMQPTTSFRDTLIWHPRLLRNILKTLRLCSASTGLTLVCWRMASLKNYLNSMEVTSEGDFF